MNSNYQSELEKLISDCKLIIWDEAPMARRYMFEAVDRTLRDLTKFDAPFGGKMFLISGDFIQILHMVPNGGRNYIINASIKRSSLWNFVQIIHLAINERIKRNIRHQNNDSIEFSKFLLPIGDGTETIMKQCGDNMIKLPQNIVSSCPTLSEFVDEI